MLSRMLPGLLKARLLRFTRLLLALGGEIVPGGVLRNLPATEAERAGQQTPEGATPGASRAEGARETIEAESVQGSIL
jgi:hypothetical protein